MEGAKLITTKTPPLGVMHVAADAAPEVEVDDEPSVPVHMNALDEIRFRQQQSDANDTEIARQIGMVIGRQITADEKQTAMAASLAQLVTYGARADAREEKREHRADAREEREATERTGKRSDRTKIILAILAIVGTLATGAGIGAFARGSADKTTTTPAVAP